MPTGHYEHHNDIDMTGEIIGYARVDSLAYRKNSRGFWNCTCLYKNCGNKFIRSRANLIKHREDANCGCLCREKSEIGQRNYYKDKGCIRNLPHGKRIYEVHHGMMSRCYNKNSKGYARYGGRGITVCDEWKNDRNAFYDWSMSNGYEDNLTIDRIDVNGNYEPSNCRWADYITQSNNKEKTKKYEYNGGFYTVTELSRLTGVYVETIRKRLQSGYSVEIACSHIHLQTGKDIGYYGKNSKGNN